MTKKISLPQKIYWKKCIIYAFLIVLLGNGINYLFGQKTVTDFLLKTVRLIQLDVLFYDFLYYIEPYLHLERLAFLQEWLWLVPFVILAFLAGAFHSYTYERRLEFKQIFLISIFVFVFKLLSYSIPYGISPVFLYFVDFVKKFYMEPALLFPACFLGLFVGTEVIVIWIKNTDAQSIMGRYK